MLNNQINQVNIKYVSTDFDKVISLLALYLVQDIKFEWKYEKANVMSQKGSSAVGGQMLKTEQQTAFH